MVTRSPVKRIINNFFIFSPVTFIIPIGINILQLKLKVAEDVFAGGIPLPRQGRGIPLKREDMG
jgi:hypothetical protein